MKLLYKIFFLLPLMALPALADAQEQRTMTFDASTSIMLSEFQAMVIMEDGNLKVAMRLGEPGSSPNNDSDRLERGDFILMMNGKRLDDIKTMRELYDSLEDGDEIKIGVRRGDQRFILSEEKGAALEGNGVRMVMNTFTTDDMLDPVLVPELGMLLVDTEEGIQINSLIEPVLPEAIKPLNIQDYYITRLNNETPSLAVEIQEFLSALEVGEEINITFSKDGDEKAVTFTKEESKANISFTTDNN